MKTVTEIVQRLLDERHITAEEAVVLLQADLNRNQPFYIPNTVPVIQPLIQPYSPPYRPGDVWYTSSTGTGISTDTQSRINPEEGD